MGGASVTLEDTTYHDVPGLHVPKYVETKKLSSLLEKLFSNGSTPCLRTAVLLGMGGAGKTQLNKTEGFEVYSGWMRRLAMPSRAACSLSASV